MFEKEGTRVMRVPENPVSKSDALASIAYLTLAANGKHHDPTLHDIAVAVVQAAPLLDLNGSPEGVTTEIEAMKIVCERHHWTDDKVVVITGRPRKDRKWRGRARRSP